MLANHNCAECLLDEDTCESISRIAAPSGEVTRPCDAYDSFIDIVTLLGFDPISRPVGDNSKNMCCVCDTDLGTCGIIWSAEGHLYCSSDCGIHDFKGDSEAFYVAAEQVNPIDIGIERICSWCGKEQEETKPTSLGYLCDQCLRAIRSRGEKVQVYE